MRVTNFTMFNLVTRSLQRNLTNMFTHTQRLSTGKKLDKPSDDPTGIARIVDYKTRLAENKQYTRNMNDAQSYLEYSDTVMGNATSNLTRARELAIQAANDSQNATTRALMAEEVKNLRDQMYDLSNTKFRDRYIFSGFSTDTAAFDSSYVYQGNTGSINVQIDRSSTITINVPGSTAFAYGGSSYAQHLDDFYTALASNDITNIRAAIDDVDNMLDQVASVRADLGAKAGRLDEHRMTLEDRNFAISVNRSNEEDADIADSTSEIAKTEVALQSLRAAGSEMLSMSLMDFIR